jgi:quercetin dioxygenase-like cupin family protein
MNVRRLALPLALAVFAGAALGQNDAHRVVQPDQIKWADVPSLPPGAKIAVLEGPMNEARPFTVRLRFPAGYRIPPHIHPAVERVTVLSGTFHLGMGEKFDAPAAQAMPAGAIAIMPSGMVHFAWTTGETVVQLHGTGPWGITYVHDADDPRKQ